MNSPSLRELYSEPSGSWSFSSPQANASASAPPATVGGPSQSWALQPSRSSGGSSIFDLSPDFEDAAGISFSEALQALGSIAFVNYASGIIATPWEVGKLLLQVQWVPRDAKDPYRLPEQDVDEGELSDSSNDNDNDSYFADPEGTPTMPAATVDDVELRNLTQGALPDYIIPAGSASGVWGMMKRVGRFRGEGWFALWKGLLTHCVNEMLSSTIQPLLYRGLRSMFWPTASVLGPSSILLPITSHVVTGFILSPLDLVRTRLMVQSFNPEYRNYTGPIDALSQIIKYEGGLSDLYLHPHLLIPNLIDNILRPFVSLALPGLLVSYFGLHINEDANPIAWCSFELASSCLGHLITLPFETVRRRLQVQVRGEAEPIRGCVELRPAPYNGVVDALWRILTEERSDLPLPHRVMQRRPSTKGKERPVVEQPIYAEEASWRSNSGVGQLYRGLGMRLTASAVVFVLALMAPDDGTSGWTEL